MQTLMKSFIPVYPLNDEKQMKEYSEINQITPLEVSIN